MSKKNWVVFWLVQGLGIWIGMLAGPCDTLAWGTSLLLLIPGIFVSLLFFTPGRIGNGWPGWSLFLLAIAANLATLEAFILVKVAARKRTE
jgi:hypothetical protein